MEVLIVVDVQPGLPMENNGNSCPWGYLVTDDLVANCLREIREAMRAGNPVVATTVSYFGVNDDWFGPTDPRLLKELRTYKGYLDVGKMASGDGAINVLRACERANRSTPPNKFRLVGVRANGCVIAMAEGLRRECPDAEITVVMDACNDDQRRLNFDEFKRISGIKLVHGTNHRRAA